ncbi:hypothetical protein FB567DRAFT_558299 [Paraphoma chrysanthemicola]|uniref:Uncharacterized protein n=1 Tax=Paraphoma chrysanthemicola TaxID=798071 RepID=A0A8K0REI3_9PLEO|nr:hypothetical protein FB567DRAFT_558299 [Paraphoma chrysanthemicola]
MTSTARHGMQKRKKKCSQQSQGLVWEDQVEPRYASYINTISEQSMITEAFYGRFLAYFTSQGDGKDIRNRVSWLHRLPQLSVDGTNGALTLAVQATASSYCAIETDNLSLARYARDLYGRAIQTHGRFLARSRTAKAGVTIHMISTSVLFSFFEAIQATNADAYRSHIYGAAKMFEVTNPKECTDGVLCQIFFHLRTQMAFVQLTSQGQKASVDIKDVLHNALSYDELPMFQRLVTHFTALADVYSELQSARTQRRLDIEEATNVETAVENLWAEYKLTASVQNEQITWRDTDTNITQYRDAFTALVCAYFSATRILLYLLSPIPLPCQLDAVEHHQSILDVAHHMETHLIGCAYMRMAAPLLLVALHGPKVEQRKKSVEYFQRWDSKGMRGITTLVVDCMHRHLVKRVSPEEEPIHPTNHLTSTRPRAHAP